MNEDNYDIDGFDSKVLLLGICGAVLFTLGYLFGSPYNADRQLIKMQKQEYSKCISELPRNKDCTVTGIVYTITSK